MSRRSLIAIGVLPLLALACGAGEEDKAQLSLGAALYEQHCAMCHGADMTPLSGVKDLRAFSGDFGLFRDTVTTGRGMMPSFGGAFTGEDLAALYAYVRSCGATPQDG